MERCHCCCCCWAKCRYLLLLLLSRALSFCRTSPNLFSCFTYFLFAFAFFHSPHCTPHLAIFVFGWFLLVFRFKPIQYLFLFSGIFARGVGGCRSVERRVLSANEKHTKQKTNKNNGIFLGARPSVELRVRIAPPRNLPIICMSSCFFFFSLFLVFVFMMLHNILLLSLMFCLFLLFAALITIEIMFMFIYICVIKINHLSYKTYI